MSCRRLRHPSNGPRFAVAFDRHGSNPERIEEDQAVLEAEMDPDDVAVDLDAARPIQGRQVLERAPLRLLGIEDDVTRGAQRVEVDGLSSRSGGCLSLVEGASVGRQRVPAVDDQPGPREQGRRPDDDEGGDGTALVPDTPLQVSKGSTKVSLTLRRP